MQEPLPKRAEWTREVDDGVSEGEAIWFSILQSREKRGKIHGDKSIGEWNGSAI